MLRPLCSRAFGIAQQTCRNLTKQQATISSPKKLRPSLQHLIFRTFASDGTWTDQRFNEIVSENKIVVFMKGTPMEPMCGFSKAVVTIFQMHGVIDLTAFNVLEDDELRTRVKEFSNWPTVPQIYMNGELVGGCDIMIQLHQTGELVKELQKIGFRSVLTEEHHEDQ